MNSLDSYFICTECENIEKESIWTKDASKSFVCVKCSSNDKKKDWPPIEIETMLNFILAYDDEALEYGQITSVFLSSVIELLLENLLYTMAYFDLSYNDAGILVDALIDAYRGRNRMLSLYKKIGYGSFRDAVDELGYSDFYKDWDMIVKVRNKVVHGYLEEGESINSLQIKSTVKIALEIFSQLHNKYNEESLTYKNSVKRKVGIDTDIDKLSKWSKAINE